MLRREGANPIFSAKFYQVVFQAMLLFGLETLVSMAMMLQNIEGLNVGFLWQVVGMTSRKLGVDTCKKEGSGRVLQTTGTKPLLEYIDMRQATVATWVAMRAILQVYAK